MLPQAMIDEIDRLLATGTYSMRSIARMTGVSRGTVATVVHGTRREYGSREAESQAAEEEATGPMKRCPECGAMARVPCRACRQRKAMRAGGRRPSGREPEEPLQLELAGEFRQRYEEIHARRVREGWQDD